MPTHMVMSPREVSSWVTIYATTEPVSSTTVYRTSCAELNLGHAASSFYSSPAPESSCGCVHLRKMTQSREFVLTAVTPAPSTETPTQ